MVAFVLLAALSGVPQPSPAPLKTIVTIQAHEPCSVLRERLEPAIGGLLENDKLSREGQAVMNHLTFDSKGEYADDLGGMGAQVSMDNMRMENVVSAMVHNIERIDSQLSALPKGGTQPGVSALVEAARDRLQHVLAMQRTELNVLSFTVGSNESNDVLAKKSQIGLAWGNSPDSMQSEPDPVSLPERLEKLRAAVARTEDDAGRAIAPLIRMCR